MLICQIWALGDGNDGQHGEVSWCCFLCRIVRIVCIRGVWRGDISRHSRSLCSSRAWDTHVSVAFANLEFLHMGTVPGR